MPPLIERLRKRVETDLDELELQAMIDEVAAEIERRYGPDGEVTVHLGDRDLEAQGRFLRLARPADTAQTILAVELYPASAGAAGAEIVLDPADFRVLNGGRTLERLIDGPNGRRFWGPSVRVTYTPVSEQARRDEVTIRIVQIEIETRGGVASERAGDFQQSYRDPSEEREKLLASLAPTTVVLA